ncbi:MAG: HNH endonuclease [Candidatus Firestonebacteria bacterium]
MKNNKAIPARTRKLIFQESNSSCPFCSETNVDTLEIHHIYERANEGGNEPENLILVCANCHTSIKNGTISKSEVIAKKYSLMQNNVSKKEVSSAAKIINFTNSVNSGIVADTVNIKTQKKSSVKILPPPNSIASDLNKRNYIKRLIERYNEFKKADRTIDVFKYSIIYGSIKREFKCKWDMISLDRFDELVNFLQRKIDMTILGKNRKICGEKNYSTYEQFLNQVK